MSIYHNLLSLLITQNFLFYEFFDFLFLLTLHDIHWCITSWGYSGSFPLYADIIEQISLTISMHQ